VQCATKSASAEQVLATLLSLTTPMPFTPAGGAGTGTGAGAGQSSHHHGGGSALTSPSQILAAVMAPHQPLTAALHGLPVPPAAHIVPASSTMPPPIGRTGSGRIPGQVGVPTPGGGIGVGGGAAMQIPLMSSTLQRRSSGSSMDTLGNIPNIPSPGVGDAANSFSNPGISNSPGVATGTGGFSLPRRLSRQTSQ
jgi:hypothetical protein